VTVPIDFAIRDVLTQVAQEAVTIGGNGQFASASQSWILTGGNIDWRAEMPNFPQYTQYDRTAIPSGTQLTENGSNPSSLVKLGSGVFELHLPLKRTLSVDIPGGMFVPTIPLSVTVEGVVVAQFTPPAGEAEGELAASVAPWQNGVNPADVNGDGVASAFDALLVINQLNSRGSVVLPRHRSASGALNLYLDPSGDGALTPADALVVIDTLNALAAAVAAGEGESDTAVPLVSAAAGLAPAERPAAFRPLSDTAAEACAFPTGPADRAGSLAAESQPAASRRAGEDLSSESSLLAAVDQIFAEWDSF
jgi:hypothetical protein